jgi:hypothetical protein
MKVLDKNPKEYAESLIAKSNGCIVGAENSVFEDAKTFDKIPNEFWSDVFKEIIKIRIHII